MPLRWSKKWVLRMVAILLVVASVWQPVAVFAEYNAEEMREISMYGGVYWDGTACETATNTICAAPSGEQITWIGDSYSVQAKDKIAEVFNGVDFGVEQQSVSAPYSYIQVSKHMKMNADEGNGGAGGVKILSDIVQAGKLRPYLVFALGTNDILSAGEMKNVLEEIANLAGQDTKVVLVTSYTTSGANYDEGNRAKREFVDAHENFYLADYATVAKSEYYASDSIHPTSNGGYDAWVDVIRAALPRNCSAGLLPGDTIEERIWNYFVQADIEGVSDNPAVIAGIMGNFYVESGYNPFMRGSNGQYWGLWMLMDSYNGVSFGSALGAEITAALGGRDYWKFYGWWGSQNTADDALEKVSASQNEIDTAIRMELDYLTKSEQNKSTWEGFVNNIQNVANNTPSGYSDLFLVKVERAINGSSPITDAGVKKMVTGGIYYQGSASRREAAEDVYGRLSSMTTAPANMNGAAINRNSGVAEAVSNGGFTRYDLTDAEIWDVAELAHNDVSVSELVNRYELQAGEFSSTGLMEYLKKDGELYVNGAKDLNLTSDEIEAARDVLIMGNRTEQAATQFKEAQSTYDNVCLDNSSDVGPSGEDIAKAAVSMAWPVQIGQGDDTHAGQCLGEDGEWLAWDSDNGMCFHNPRELYRQQKSMFSIGGDYYEDSGWFAATVFYYAGVDDNGGMPKGNTGSMMSYMSRSEKWDEISNDGNENNLRPGDVFVSNHHISIYVGQIGGTYGKQVAASSHERVGIVTHDIANNDGNRYVDSEGEMLRIFRRVNNAVGEGGLTFEQAKIFMMNYGANKNGSSQEAVALDGSQWKLGGCAGGGGSNCVTFSAFFLNKFTDSRRGKGNGNLTAPGARNVEGKGTKPKVWAVFSGGTDASPHTGVILGYHDGEWIVGHASCSDAGNGKGTGGDGTYRGRGGGAGFVIKSTNICTALVGYCPTNYAYPKNVDTEAIGRYLETGE